MDERKLGIETDPCSVCEAFEEQLKVDMQMSHWIQVYNGYQKHIGLSHVLGELDLA